jgi:hypothetical protein
MAGILRDKEHKWNNGPSLRAERSNPPICLRRHGLLRRFAPLRKRPAFVAGNDESKDHVNKKESQA